MTDLTDFATKYAPAPESTDHIEIKDRYSLFINGEFTKPASGEYFPTINPATEKTLSEVAEADKVDVDKAVQSARKAYENTWSKIPAKERGKYIYRISRMLQERSREFAVIESMDGGKPIRESRDVDIPLAAAHFFIMRAGQTSWNMHFLEDGPDHWVWPDRLFRGIFHFSWPPGNWLLHWHAEILL